MQKFYISRGTTRHADITKRRSSIEVRTITEHGEKVEYQFIGDNGNVGIYLEFEAVYQIGKNCEKAHVVMENAWTLDMLVHPEKFQGRDTILKMATKHLGRIRLTCEGPEFETGGFRKIKGKSSTLFSRATSTKMAPEKGVGTYASAYLPVHKVDAEMSAEEMLTSLGDYRLAVIFGHGKAELITKYGEVSGVDIGGSDWGHQLSLLSHLVRLVPEKANVALYVSNSGLVRCFRGENKINENLEAWASLFFSGGKRTVELFDLSEVPQSEVFVREFRKVPKGLYFSNSLLKSSRAVLGNHLDLSVDVCCPAGLSRIPTASKEDTEDLDRNAKACDTKHNSLSGEKKRQAAPRKPRVAHDVMDDIEENVDYVMQAYRNAGKVPKGGVRNCEYVVYIDSQPGRKTRVVLPSGHLFDPPYMRKKRGRISFYNVLDTMTEYLSGLPRDAQVLLCTNLKMIEQSAVCAASISDKRDKAMKQRMDAWTRYFKEASRRHVHVRAVQDVGNFLAGKIPECPWKSGNRGLKKTAKLIKEATKGSGKASRVTAYKAIGKAANNHMRSIKEES